MNKVELEAKVDALTDEINFLRSLYEAVRPFCFLWVLQCSNTIGAWKHQCAVARDKKGSGEIE